MFLYREYANTNCARIKEYPSDGLPGYGEIRPLVDKGFRPRKYFCLSSLVCDTFAQLRAVSYTEALSVVVKLLVVEQIVFS
jgi:hypothetical protein